MYICTEPSGYHGVCASIRGKIHT